MSIFKCKWQECSYAVSQRGKYLMTNSLLKSIKLKECTKKREMPGKQMKTTITHGQKLNICSIRLVMCHFFEYVLGFLHIFGSKGSWKPSFWSCFMDSHKQTLHSSLPFLVIPSSSSHSECQKKWNQANLRRLLICSETILHLWYPEPSQKFRNYLQAKPIFLTT